MKYSDIKVGDTIKITAPASGNAPADFWQFTVDYVSVGTLKGKTFGFLAYDIADATIELINRPKRKIAVGELISLDDLYRRVAIGKVVVEHENHYGHKNRLFLVTGGLVGISGQMSVHFGSSGLNIPDKPEYEVLWLGDGADVTADKLGRN